jgi:transposase
VLFKTILNNQYNFKSFIYDKVFFENSDTIIVTIKPRKNSKAICSGCHKPASSYDKRDYRDFEFIPYIGFKVIFRYLMRRVDCEECGVKIEEVPWAIGKNTLTIPFILVIADWAKSLSWKETGERFKVSWQKVFNSVEYVVNWGLKHRNLDNIETIGIDEIAYRIGHHYLTLVYQIDQGFKRLLWAGAGRNNETITKFFTDFGKERAEKLKYVCSDMWKPYLKAINEFAAQAVHVLDRFHIMKKINLAIDAIRSEEAKKLSKTSKGKGHVLTNARWVLLKRKENLTEKQELKLGDLLKSNLKSVKAYLLKLDFDGLWNYVSPWWAGIYIDRWTKRVMYSKIEPMKKIAKMIRSHKKLILNWFIAKGRLSSGVVEGMNNKIKVTMKKAYGFRTEKCLIIALYHAMGALPTPELTHRFM